MKIFCRILKDVYKRQEFINDTRGEGTMVRRFDGFDEYKGDIPQRTNGVAIAQEEGVATPYAPVSYTHLDVYKRQVISCLR